MNNLDDLLIRHKSWLESDGDKGECASLSGENLSEVNLTEANLSKAYLWG